MAEYHRNRWPTIARNKQPFTKMTARYFRNTRSGCPGSLGLFNLYRNPRLNKIFSPIIPALSSRFLSKTCNDDVALRSTHQPFCLFLSSLSIISLLQNHSILISQFLLFGAGSASLILTIIGIGTQFPKIKASPGTACLILVI